MIRVLLDIARPVAGWLAASLAARVVNLVCGVALLVVPAWAIVAAHAGEPVSPWGAAVALAAIAVLKGAARYLEHFWGHHAAFDLLARMRIALYDAALPLSAADEESGSADLTAVATRDIDRVEVFFAHTIVPAVAAVIVPAGIVVAVGAVAGLAAAGIALAAFALGAAAPLIARRGTARAAEARAAAQGAIAQHVAEDGAGRIEIRTLGAEDARLSRLASLERDAGRAVRAGATRQGVRAAVGAVWPLIGALCLIAIAPAGAAGAHILSAAALVGAAPAVQAVEAFSRSLPAALASARRYLAVVGRTPAIVDPDRPAAVPDGPLGVRFDGVSAGHGAEPVVAGVSAQVAPGGRLAIVGPSGGGKSTLVSLLLRDRDPLGGRVLLTSAEGERDVSEIALADLRRAVAIVAQRPVLIRGSVLDNLRLGAPELTEEQAWRALEDAQLADDVRAHPAGLAAQLSDDALSLSGGQRQRLSLARALAREPRILVLDEATSHQDPATQRAVRLALERRAGLTAIVVAHRPEAALEASAILRLG